MRHPARGPIGTMGIDGKPSAASRRLRLRSIISALKEAAA
jgi:hypothetical protein